MKKDFDRYATFDNKSLDDDLSNLVNDNPLDNLNPELKNQPQNNFKKYKVFDQNTMGAMGRQAPLLNDLNAPQNDEEPLDPSVMKDICSHHVCPVCVERANMPDPTAEREEERLRMLAEMDNFKKRLTREKDEQVRFASEAVLGDLLPSLDNFELALTYGKDTEACREMLQGLEMTHKLLLDALAEHGLEKVGQVGEPFNPEVHEAMTREPRDDMEPGHVSQLFQPGYKLRERLLRPAKVVVSM